MSKSCSTGLEDQTVDDPHCWAVVKPLPECFISLDQNAGTPIITKLAVWRKPLSPGLAEGFCSFSPHDFA